MPTKTGEYKNCPICQKQFYVELNLIKMGKGKTCSRICSRKSVTGIPSPMKGKKVPFKPHPWKLGQVPKSAFKKGCIPWSKGKSLIGIKSDEKIYNWKGDNCSYRSLHDWVKRRLGKANVCTDCGSIANVEWANKSHEYKRDIGDWLSLCHKCHMIYDRSSDTWGSSLIKFPERKRYGKQHQTS